jgi:hypothetical protein
MLAAQNETTLAFYNAYHDNDDVDNELAHLQKEVMVLTHEQDEELDDNSHGVVTAAEIRERVREIAQQDEARFSLSILLNFTIDDDMHIRCANLWTRMMCRGLTENTLKTTTRSESPSKKSPLRREGHMYAVGLH